jgi:transcriptional regulator with XRE-family HTH domain
MRQNNEIQKAARELRVGQKFSQQTMASLLGLSIGLVRNYEQGLVETPEPRPLYSYMCAAQSLGQPHLAAVFRRSLNRALDIDDYWDGQLETEPIRPVPRLLVAAALASIYGKLDESGADQFRSPVLQALRGPAMLLIRKLRLRQNKATWAEVRIDLKVMGLPASWLREEGL